MRSRSLVGVSHVSRTCLAGVSQVSRSNKCETGARHVRDTSEACARQLEVIYSSTTPGLPVITGCSKNSQKMVKKWPFYDHGINLLIFRKWEFKKVLLFVLESVKFES